MGGDDHPGSHDDRPDEATADDPASPPMESPSADDDGADDDAFETGIGWLDNRYSSAKLSKANRVLTWTLALVLVIALAGVIFVAVNPPQTAPSFTEFYLLGPNGTASGYPTNLTPGETGPVIVGISNHENKPTEYRVQMTRNGTTVGERRVTIPDGETSEFRMNITAPPDPGRYRVRFVLYNETSSEPYMVNRLWISVGNGTEPSAAGT